MGRNIDIILTNRPEEREQEWWPVACDCAFVGAPLRCPPKKILRFAQDDRSADGHWCHPERSEGSVHFDQYGVAVDEIHRAVPLPLLAI